MEEKVYLNGSLVPLSEANISVQDYGFLYGYGVFETMRAYNGKIFLLERHIKRLSDSARIIGLGGKLAGIDLARACMDTLEANRMKEARVRMTVTGGESEVYPWAETGGKPTVVITARSYKPFTAEKYRQGFHAGIASVRRSRESLIPTIKSSSYLVSVIARNEAAAQGLDEALLLNNDGFIAEGGGSNVFFMKSSRLVTPSLDSGILPGITRNVVMALAEELGIIVTEGTVGIGIIRQCDEAFLTNSVMEIMPLTEVSDTSGHKAIIGEGKAGKITNQLMAAYKKKVKKETT